MCTFFNKSYNFKYMLSLSVFSMFVGIEEVVYTCYIILTIYIFFSLDLFLISHHNLGSFFLGLKFLQFPTTLSKNHINLLGILINVTWKTTPRTCYFVPQQVNSSESQESLWVTIYIFISVAICA